MDILCFLKRRTSFIRKFYENAASPFEETKRKIEAEEDPYIPPHNEDSEPAFLEEWMEAKYSLDVLGHTCISMLAASLELYLQTWDKELGLKCKANHEGAFNKKKGWINGYRTCFREELGIRWEESPADLHLLEEIVLARNRAQHPDSITRDGITYSKSDGKKLRQIFFVDDIDMQMLSVTGGIDGSWMFPPALRVKKDKLCTAIAEVEKFCDWLDERIQKKVRSI